MQTIRGNVSDKSIKTILSGATIELLDNVKRTVAADINGNFLIEKVSVGRHNLRISYIGYKPVFLNNLLIESGKQTVLQIELEEDIITTKEVIVQSKPNKSKPINEMAVVSARMFSVEETRRFAAGLNDPSRIATAFAGVVSQGDANNLIIRGNAPNGLLWRMEGVDIPNPNHFAKVGTSGGGISILSAQLLANSDFMTSAFPAEFGNALSGVFDIKLRKGNNTKREYTFSASTIGVDAATEGYFKKGYGGSYLINYRYSFLTLMQQLGLNIGEAATYFQDLSFNIHLPTKKIGTFSVFGFGGLSDQKAEASTDSIVWTNNSSKRTGRFNASKTGMIGFAHTIALGKKTLLKTIYSANGYQYDEQNSRLDKFNGPLIYTRYNQFKEINGIWSMVATHKFNPNHLLKIGAYTSAKGYDLNQRESVNNVLKDKVKSDGDTRLTNYFAQWKWSPSNQFSFLAGLHGQHFALNKTSVIEPRIGMKWMTAKNQYLSMGVGLHSQIQPLGNYFARIRVGTDTLQPNKSLSFSRATHYVIGYSIQLAPNWNLKTEIYYQWLYAIPVSASTKTSFSMINQDDDYAIEALSNKGNGKNYGVELTLERYWNDQFYLLSSLSLYESKYLPSDKVWRNTRFNSNTTFTFLMGKEWNLKGKHSSTFSLDLKMIYAGGVRVTPIDLTKSIAQKTTVFDNNRIYEDKLSNIFRIDFQTEWKVQYGKKTGSLIVGVQNLLNQKNPVSQSYDPISKQIKYSYLLGLIPVIGYKVDF
ncbi:MAG: TonB-dependent receptor [Sphingobacteriia bacterium]